MHGTPWRWWQVDERFQLAGRVVVSPDKIGGYRLAGNMVGERGFEPPTPWSRTRCSTRLSHSPTSLERNEHPRQTVEKRAVTTHSVVIITFALLRPSCEVECAALVDS